jgi:hypothetical protein
MKTNKSIPNNKKIKFLTPNFGLVRLFRMHPSYLLNNSILPKKESGTKYMVIP